jgi:queuosine precursor transporter
VLQRNDKINYQYKYFSFLSMFYCTLLTASILLPYKIINFFGFSEPGGIFIFPLTYLLGGAIAEAYGRAMALRMVYSSIFCLSVFTVIIAIIIRIPSIPNAPHQEVFIQAFGHGIRLTVGCFAGLLCSDLTNVYKITKLKLLFGGKYFVQRCLWSTAISEAIFNITTYTITYAGIIPTNNIFKLMVYSWILKMIYSLIMIFPLLLLMHFLKNAEDVDVYDVEDTVSGFNLETVLLTFLRASAMEEKKYPKSS